MHTWGTKTLQIRALKRASSKAIADRVYGLHYLNCKMRAFIGMRSQLTPHSQLPALAR